MWTCSQHWSTRRLTKDGNVLFAPRGCVILVLYEETIEFALSVRCLAVGIITSGNSIRRDGLVALDGREEESLDFRLGSQ